MNTYDLTGRVALVTGGASGIGAAAARLLKAGGAEVVTFDLDSSADVQGDVRPIISKTHLPYRGPAGISNSSA